MNKCMFAGRLAAEPEMKAENVLRFNVAVNERKYNSNTKTYEDDATYVPITVFGKRATSLSKVLKKGQSVSVTSHMKKSSWESIDGQKHYATNFVLDDITL